MKRTDIEEYIRQAAAARGIDPDIAVRVARSEGGVNSWNRQSDVVKNGVREPSYGPFQMYMGGGLGNKFQAATGLSPSDETAGPAAIDFALDHAAKNGWGSWYGAKNVGIGNFDGIGGSPSGSAPARPTIQAQAQAQAQAQPTAQPSPTQTASTPSSAPAPTPADKPKTNNGILVQAFNRLTGSKFEIPDHILGMETKDLSNGADKLGKFAALMSQDTNNINSQIRAASAAAGDAPATPIELSFISSLNPDEIKKKKGGLAGFGGFSI